MTEEPTQASIANIDAHIKDTNKLFARFNELMDDFNSTDANFLQNCHKNIVLGEHIAHIALAISLVNKEIMRMAEELSNANNSSE